MKKQTDRQTGEHKRKKQQRVTNVRDTVSNLFRVSELRLDTRKQKPLLLVLVVMLKYKCVYEVRLAGCFSRQVARGCPAVPGLKEKQSS